MFRDLLVIHESLQTVNKLTGNKKLLVLMPPSQQFLVFQINSERMLYYLLLSILRYFRSISRYLNIVNVALFENVAKILHV